MGTFKLDLLERCQTTRAAPPSPPAADLLKSLKEKSEANRGARKKALEDLYCRRQVLWGCGSVGSTGGVRGCARRLPDVPAVAGNSPCAILQPLRLPIAGGVRRWGLQWAETDSRHDEIRRPGAPRVVGEPVRQVRVAAGTTRCSMSSVHVVTHSVMHVQADQRESNAAGSISLNAWNNRGAALHARSSRGNGRSGPRPSRKRPPGRAHGQIYLTSCADSTALECMAQTRRSSAVGRAVRWLSRLGMRRHSGSPACRSGRANLRALTSLLFPAHSSTHYEQSMAPPGLTRFLGLSALLSKAARGAPFASGGLLAARWQGPELARRNSTCGAPGGSCGSGGRSTHHAAGWHGGDPASLETELQKVGLGLLT